MKFGVVNKSTTVNIFVLHTLQHNITHLAVITHETNMKFGILKGRDKKKKPIVKLTKRVVDFFADPRPEPDVASLPVEREICNIKGTRKLNRGQ